MKDVDLLVYQLESSDVWFIALSKYPDLFAIMPHKYYAGFEQQALEKSGEDIELFGSCMTEQLILAFFMTQLQDELVDCPIGLPPPAELRWHVTLEDEDVTEIFIEAKELLTSNGIQLTNLH